VTVNDTARRSRTVDVDTLMSVAHLAETPLQRAEGRV
jgi:hypothetical protein